MSSAWLFGRGPKRVGPRAATSGVLLGGWAGVNVRSLVFMTMLLDRVTGRDDVMRFPPGVGGWRAGLLARPATSPRPT